MHSDSTLLEEVLEPTDDFIEKESTFKFLCETLYPFSHPEMVMEIGDASLVVDSLIYNEVPIGCVYKALKYLEEIGVLSSSCSSSDEGLKSHVSTESGGIQISEKKVFMDVGSGIGKAVFMALAIYPYFAKYIGIEIYEPRHKLALDANRIYKMKSKENEKESFESGKDVKMVNKSSNDSDAQIKDSDKSLNLDLNKSQLNTIQEIIGSTDQSEWHEKIKEKES